MTAEKIANFLASDNHHQLDKYLYFNKLMIGGKEVTNKAFFIAPSNNVMLFPSGHIKDTLSSTVLNNFFNFERDVEVQKMIP